MPQKSLDRLTESMFYVLMAFTKSPKCGAEIAEFVEKRSGGELKVGPATLYTILSKFESVKYIREIEVDGRKRTYEITPKGLKSYNEELERLKRMLRDAQSEET